jgi:hypothetical protein
MDFVDNRDFNRKNNPAFSRWIDGLKASDNLVNKDAVFKCTDKGISVNTIYGRVIHTVTEGRSVNTSGGVQVGWWISNGEFRGKYLHNVYYQEATPNFHLQKYDSVQFRDNDRTNLKLSNLFLKPYRNTDIVNDKYAYRNSSLITKVKNQAGYTCFFTGIQPFISKSNSKPYCEVHHGIMLKSGFLSPEELDVKENMFVCHDHIHAKLHNSTLKEIKPYLDLMWADGRMQSKFNITYDEFIDLYR